MSDRGGGRNNGRGGRGHGGRGGRGRGKNYTGSANTTKKGMCANLGTNVFDYGQKSAADLMRTSWEKLVKYVITNYGQDISNELQNKIYVDIIELVHSAEVLRKHGLLEAIIRSGQRNIQWARQAQEKILEAAVPVKDPDAPMKLAILQNEIAQGDFSSSNEVEMELNDSEKMQFSNEWRTFRERNANLIKHRGQAFSLIQGHCTQLLQDKMKQDTEWNNVSTSYDPLTLYRLIERTVLTQTEDQYTFATVYDQELSFYSFRQETLSNPQWYERFNTKVDVGDAIGVTLQHKVLLEYF
jgi:ribosomal protein L15